MISSEAIFKATVNLEIGTDVLAQQTIGINDNNLLEVDDAFCVWYWPHLIMQNLQQMV